MGLAKTFWMDEQEQIHQERKEEWIKEQLGDSSADENTEGWSQLSDEYDALDSDRDVYEDDWSVVGKTRLEIFNENITASREIIKITLSESSTKNLFVMLHAHVVTAVEAYLSSTFIEKALSAQRYIRLLVETDPEFAKRKFSMQEIFTKQDALKNELNSYLKDLIFHDIAKVKLMFLSVLEIDFGEITWLYEAVAIRHHCVHRAGYDKSGEEVQLTFASIEKLINEAANLVRDVENSILSMPDDEYLFWSKK